MTTRESIAEGILSEMCGQSVSLDGRFALCPGHRLHSTKDGRKDFQVMLDGAPTGYCLHGSCLDVVAEFNKRLRREIWFAEHGREAAPRGHWGEGVSAEPHAAVKARPKLDEGAIADHVRGVPEIDEEWLRKRSPVDVRGMGSGEFLDALYVPGERVLVLVREFSQGDFLWCSRGRRERATSNVERSTSNEEGEERLTSNVERLTPKDLGAEATLGGGWRLSQDRGVRAVRSVLPKGGEKGVWFLVQPVTGCWALVSDKARNEKTGELEERAKWTRRSHVNVTAFRYFVLESDVLPAATWLRVVANLAVPIAALYTSGKKSIHALVKMEVPSKGHFDQVRDALRQLVCPLGADPAAITAVRLSRLPGTKRGPNEQRLLWLNPDAQYERLWLMPELRA